MFRKLIRQIGCDFSRLKATQSHYPAITLYQTTIINQFLSVTPKWHLSEKQYTNIKESPFSSTLIADSDDLTIDECLPGEDRKFAVIKLISKADAVQILSDELYIGRQSSEKIFEKETKLRYLNRANYVRVIELIKKHKIASQTVEQFPWILAMTSYNLASKLDTLLQMDPKKIDDFIPLLRVSSFRLLKIMCIMKNEEDVIPGGNRIYYMASKLEVPPQTLCNHIARRLFMLEIPAQSLVDSLETMLEYGISPTSIMRDLWAFRYNVDSMKDRLQRAKKAHKSKLMPWMVRCPESILQKSLRLAADEKKILGDKGDVYDYLSHRLEFDLETTKAIVSKHPAVARVRLTKVKEILDYLLNEADFTRHDIAQVPRILSHGLETTKRRLKELESYGCRPNSLVILCKSKREYQKFVENWLHTRQKMKR